MLEHALAYIAYGIAVFPLHPGDNTPMTPNGFKNATLCVDQARRWWEATPDANIGGLTGERVSVIDVDSPEGWGYLEQMLRLDYFPEVLGIARTTKRFGDGDSLRDCGAHYYIPAQPLFSNGRGRAIGEDGFVPGCDALGGKGYVVMPPSIIDERCRDPKKHRGTYLWEVPLV